MRNVVTAMRSGSGKIYVASIGPLVVLTKVCTSETTAITPVTRASTSIAVSGKRPCAHSSAPNPLSVGTTRRPNAATSSSVISASVVVIMGSPGCAR